MYNVNLTGFDYLLIRSTSMWIISVIQVIYLRLNVLDVPKEDRINLFIRWMLGAIAMPTYSYGLKYIPATVAALIFNISPILVTILAIIFLHEQFTKIKILIVLGAFVGVILFLSGKDTKNPEHSNYFLGILCWSVSCVLGSFERWI